MRVALPRQAFNRAVEAGAAKIKLLPGIAKSKHLEVARCSKVFIDKLIPRGVGRYRGRDTRGLPLAATVVKAVPCRLTARELIG